MTDIKRLTELIEKIEGWTGVGVIRNVQYDELRDIRAILCAVRADMEDRATR